MPAYIPPMPSGPALLCFRYGGLAPRPVDHLDRIAHRLYLAPDGPTRYRLEAEYCRAYGEKWTPAGADSAWSHAFLIADGCTIERA